MEVVDQLTCNESKEQQLLVSSATKSKKQMLKPYKGPPAVDHRSKFYGSKRNTDKIRNMVKCSTGKHELCAPCI